MASLQKAGVGDREKQLASTRKKGRKMNLPAVPKDQDRPINYPDDMVLTRNGGRGASLTLLGGCIVDGLPQNMELKKPTNPCRSLTVVGSRNIFTVTLARPRRQTIHNTNTRWQRHTDMDTEPTP